MIRLQATAGIPTLERGRHQIRFQNAHEPAMSVYLVNALFPSNPGIRITKQTRDQLQREYLMEVVVRGRLPGHPGFVLIGSLAGPLLLAVAVWVLQEKSCQR